MRPTEAVAIHEYLSAKVKLVDRLLDEFIPPASTPPRTLHEAMRYSVMAGGKRIRPILAMAAFEYSGGKEKYSNRAIEYAMASLEMIHTYSLIHDDLPCMDDDDLRRGQPTCHKRFGEAAAVLAGDALHDIAFALMAKTGSTEVVTELASAIGTFGMIGGQIADVEAEGRKISEDEIIRIHNCKTGSLIRSSVRIGALLAGADSNTLYSLSKFGEKVGLAFQIIDDILDIEGSAELLGKKVGSDCLKKKATYPGVVGLIQARQDADRLIDEAINNLNSFGDNMLVQIALYIGQREK